MARQRKAEIPLHEDHDQVVAWYRQRLVDEPASMPWTSSQWAPVRVGPTWQTTDDGHWMLPDATLGWDVLGWCGTNLQHSLGVPWRFTLEQARFILWLYAVDEAGRWRANDVVLQRMKGWGKDPLAGCVIYTELCGPCRFAGWDGDRPIAADNPHAWIQAAAVSLDQTRNTMLLMPSLITAAARRRYTVRVGKELIYAYGGERLVQAVTSSPATLEGARASMTLKNETHLWTASNGGHAMAAVIERNATKSPEGQARTLAITNAPEPGEDSVAERDWAALESPQGRHIGLMIDSLEAPPQAGLVDAREVVPVVRGDSVWLDVDRIIQSISDPRNPASRSRRFWYNQRVAAEDAWLDPLAVDAAKVECWIEHYMPAVPSERFVMFFDGAKSDDATALAGCRMNDGLVMTLGVWQRPAGGAGEGWTVDRGEVDARVRQLLDTGLVTAFYADPSHTRDDDLTGYWDGIIDGWHRDYGDVLQHWAVRTGAERHSVMWDMTSPARLSQFTTAAEVFVEEIESVQPLLHWDGHPAMRDHLRNARRAPNRWGVSLAKEHRESRRKIDLAVCAVGARMLRRVVLNGPQEKPRTGIVYV